MLPGDKRVPPIAARAVRAARPIVDERLRFRWELGNRLRRALFMRLLGRLNLLADFGGLFLPRRELLLIFAFLLGRREIEIIARENRREKRRS